MKIVIFDVEDRDGSPLEFQLVVFVERAMLESVNYIVVDEEVGWIVSKFLFEVVERSGDNDDVEQDFADFGDFAGMGIEHREH